MDMFDYDCLGAVNQFCNDDIDKQLEKASKKLATESRNILEESKDSVDLEKTDGEIEIIDKKKSKTKAKLNENDSILLSSGNEDERCGSEVEKSQPGRRKSKRNASKPQPVSINLTKDTKTKRKSANKTSNNVIIDLDDTNNSSLGALGFNSSVLSDVDSENLTIKVQWRNEIEKISHRKYQKFLDLMEVFAKREQCSVHDILFNLENKIVSPEDSPHSIDYKFYDIICGRVVPNCNAMATTTQSSNTVLLKIQSNFWKKPLEIGIEKTEKFSVLCAKLAEEIKLKVEDFTLIFDGEELVLSETPDDLDFDGGELIDCKLKANANHQMVDVTKPARPTNKIIRGRGTRRGRRR